jgi:subtilisin family serine protease
MKPIRLIVAAALFSGLFCVAVADQPGPSGVVVPAITGAARGHDDTTLLIRFKSGTTSTDRAAARALVNGALLRRYSLVSGLEHVGVHGGLDVARAVAILRRHPSVAYAHPNYRVAANQQQPDDEYIGEQWPLNNTGQGSLFGVWPPGVPDADIDWPEAWSEAAGDGSIVAVLDTGIDYRHSDLQANVWINAVEAGGVPGVDDDGNGYVDDIRGWDFVNSDNNPLDGHGHGSHVAGTIAAVANNGVGVAGVMWSGRVMALKILDDSGFGLLSDAVEALQYAVAKGVRVSNSSWGYSEYLPEEEADHNALRDAIDAARLQDHLFVAAAGNEGTNGDVAPHYPSSFDLDNIISVAATDNNDQLAWFSSYGPTSVDLAAPGDYVFSTYKLFAGALDDYAWLSGTSMATPHVAAVAALLVGLQPEWTYQQVRDQILSHVRSVGVLAGTSVTGGILNVHDALDGVPADGGGGGDPGPGTPPPTPAGLAATNLADGSARVAWSDVEGELGYQLEREKRHRTRGYIGTLSLQAAADADSLVDVTGDGDFRYRIRSYNDAGYSSWSIWVEVTVTGGRACRGKKCL